MRETRRIPSRLLALLLFVALTGLAASCGGGEQPSGGGEASTRESESAQAAAPAEETTTKPEEKAEPGEKTEPKEETKAKEEGSPREQTAQEDPPEQYAGEQTAQEDPPEQYAEEQYAGEQTAQEDPPEQYAEEQYDEVAAAPVDPTMSLSVPALGVSGVPVINENSEAALTAGVMHLPGTGFPWQGVGSNTYIAGHRIGWPGTPSDRVFYDLPSIQQGDEVILTNANGTVYTYQVTEIFGVLPEETWVTEPIPGREVVSLQASLEAPDDWFTIGPRIFQEGGSPGRLIVRADRV